MERKGKKEEEVIDSEEEMLQQCNCDACAELFFFREKVLIFGLKKKIKSNNLASSYCHSAAGVLRDCGCLHLLARLTSSPEYISRVTSAVLGHSRGHVGHQVLLEAGRRAGTPGSIALLQGQNKFKVIWFWRRKKEVECLNSWNFLCKVSSFVSEMWFHGLVVLTSLSSFLLYEWSYNILFYALNVFWEEKNMLLCLLPF